MFHPLTTEINEAAQQAKAVYFATKLFCQSKGARLFIFYPNNDPGHSQVVQSILDQMGKDVAVIKNLPTESFLRLLSGCKMLVGNSSCGIRECSYLGIPAVNIGLRQESRQHADNLVNSGFKNIAERLEFAWNMEVKPSDLFGKGDACEQIITILKDKYE